MLKWIDIVKFANNGNPVPDRRVEKSEAEWKKILSPEQFQITRLKGTERANSSEMCSLFEPGIYSCVCCGTLLFDANEKFESGSGWPSFTQPIKENAIAYHKDTSYGMVRVETTCNTCDSHLGHVFPDGPEPSGLRYCMNALALKKTEQQNEKATFGGGCFWCTEALFQKLDGVESVESGYSGGQLANPTYREVCSGRTGHAEVIQVTYDPSKISFEDLVMVHMGTHNPTLLNQQGADKGTQYRSIILAHNENQKAIAQKVIEELNPHYEKDIVTEIKDFQVFYKAEDNHQNYYASNPDKPYCQMVIRPKLEKLEKLLNPDMS